MEETTHEKKRRTVYTIIDRGPGKGSYWMKIGVCWTNRDQSMNIYLDALPFDRKLQIRDEELRPRSNASGEHLPPVQPSFDIGGIQ